MREADLEKLFAEFEPTARELRRFDSAVSAYNDWDEYRVLPERGGTLNQPIIWHIWMKVIRSAFRSADNERDQR